VKPVKASDVSPDSPDRTERQRRADKAKHIVKARRAHQAALTRALKETVGVTPKSPSKIAVQNIVAARLEDR